MAQIKSQKISTSSRISHFSKLLLLFSFLCVFQITEYGYISVPTKNINSISIKLKSHSTIIIRYDPPQYQFLEAVIMPDDGDEIKILLDQSQGVVIHGSKVQLHIKTFDSFTSIPQFLDFWILPENICPKISFEIPNKTDFSLELHSNQLYEPFCIFLPRFNFKMQQTINYGIQSRRKSIINFFTNISKTSYSNPYQICTNQFCQINVQYPGFFQIFVANLSTFSVYFSFIYENKVNLSSFLSDNLPMPMPMPFYNSSGEYSFGNEFDIKKYKLYSNQHQNTKLIITAASSSGAVLMFLLFVLNLIVQYSIFKNNQNNHKESSNSKRPLASFLNYYSPKTAAILISTT